MAKIELSAPTLIMTYGYPGAGKSFVARQLADHIKAAEVSEDRVRSELFDRPTYEPKENSIIESLCEYLVQEFLQAGLSVIYDGDTNETAKRRALRTISSKLRAKNLIIWTQIDGETALARVSSRDRRRADDRNARQLDQLSFKKAINSMQNPTSIEDYVVISGKHVFSSQLSSIVAKLRNMGLAESSEAAKKITKPGMVNLIPNPAAGRYDPFRRDIRIR